MKKNFLYLVFCLLAISSISIKVEAAPCDGSKSAFFDAIVNDLVNLNETTDIRFGTEKTVVNTLNSFRQRSGARVIFTAPGTGSESKTATITITTSSIDPSTQILQFALGPVTEGLSSCSERAFSVKKVTSKANNPTLFNSDDLKDLAPNNGNSSYIISTSAQGIPDTEDQSYGARFKLKVLPGQDYEVTCGSITELGDAQGTQYDCNIKISITGENGNDGGAEEPEEPIELSPEQTEAVKIQPATTESACPLSFEDHLNTAIQIEQALKSRIDRQAQELQDAFDAVGQAGTNPGPALRRLDALVEFVRDDIDETRNVVKGGLEFSKRHLECAKQKTDDTLAKAEIDQAIVNDDAAITAINTENTDINEESIRLKGSLEASSQRITSALADKDQAGVNVDPSFETPSFEGQTSQEVFDNFQVNVSNLAEQMVSKLNTQQDIITANDKNAAIDAILGVQADDCINQFFDEVVNEYTKLHTKVKDALKTVEEEAKANTETETPDPEAPTVREGKRASRSVKAVDKAYKRTVKAVKRAQKKYQKTYGSGLVGSAQKRFEKKVRTLLKLLRRAELAKDNTWRRLIRRELKKLNGVNVGI